MMFGKLICAARHLLCRCECHRPYPDPQPWEYWVGTPKHHDKPCCNRFVGTVNRRTFGWPLYI
jgi:hypothetical protein